MGNTITRRRKEFGVEINITVHKKKYDLYIDIAQGAAVPMEVKGDGFKVKLTYFDGTVKLQEPLHFARNKKPYNCKKNVLLDSLYIIKTEEYKLVVTISPSLYASAETMEELKKRQEGKKGKKDQKKKRGAMPSKGGYASAWSKSTPFTHNNAFRPYGGGRCSPK